MVATADVLTAPYLAAPPPAAQSSDARMSVTMDCDAPVFPPASPSAATTYPWLAISSSRFLCVVGSVAQPPLPQAMNGMETLPGGGVLGAKMVCLGSLGFVKVCAG
jgi:hypothetical protein